MDRKSEHNGALSDQFDTFLKEIEEKDEKSKAEVNPGMWHGGGMEIHNKTLITLNLNLNLNLKPKLPNYPSPDTKIHKIPFLPFYPVT